MVRLAVIADDLTGANDTAVQFAKHGIGTSVQIDAAQERVNPLDTDVIVLNTDSRDMNRADAYEKVKIAATLLKKQQVEHVYKKVDSTLRGNFGTEIAAMADVFQPELIVIAPAFPKNKRITVGGYHFLEGVPIEMTEIGKAPKTPVHDSYIAGLIEAQLGRCPVLIPLAIIKQGAPIVKKAIAAYLLAGQHWIIFDIVKDEHFETILEAVAAYRNILWVGSAGLADHLPKFYEWQPGPKIQAEPAEGPVLIVAGSVSCKTQLQIAQARQEKSLSLVKIDMPALFVKEKVEISRCAREIQTGLSSGADVLLVSSIDDSDVEQAFQAGKKCGLSGKEVSEYTAQTIATIVEKLDLTHLTGMFLTGGDTAVHVLKKLGATDVEILSEISTGIPLGRLRGGSCDGLKVVTKAGAFGEKDCFVRAMEVIRGVFREDV